MSHEISRRSALGAGLAATGAAIASALPATGASAATRAGATTSAGAAPGASTASALAAARGATLGGNPYRVTAAYARLGNSTDLTWQATGWENISAWPGDGDGSLDSSNVGAYGGVGCWSTAVGASSPNYYIYFKVAANFKPTMAGHALVRVVYYDTGPGQFAIDYGSSTTAYAQSQIVAMTGGGVWRTHDFILPDAYFNNLQNDQADFRIAVVGPGFGPSQSDIHVSDVAVSFANFYPYEQVSVLSPVPGADISGRTTISFYAPGMVNVEGHAEHQPDATHPDKYDAKFDSVSPLAPDGHGTLSFPASQFPAGPMTIRIDAWNTPPGDNSFTASDVFYLQVNNTGGVSYNQGIPAADPPAAAGMTLAYADDFTGPLSISYTGAGTTYSAVKPDWSQPDGIGQYGDGIFADPAGVHSAPYNAYSVIDDQYLRIRSQRVPVGYADPEPWDRRHFGGTVSSIDLNGNGVAVQYGYFEARISMPAGTGTWPSFWMLPQPPIATRTGTGPTVEIDITEQLGGLPFFIENVVGNYHVWGEDTGSGSGNGPYLSSNPTMTNWHVYGVKIDPDNTTFYVDDTAFFTIATSSVGGGPMFFMLALELGSGWPVNLTTKYGDQVDMYVDYVRVYSS